MGAFWYIFGIVEEAFNHSPFFNTRVRPRQGLAELGLMWEHVEGKVETGLRGPVVDARHVRIFLSGPSWATKLLCRDPKVFSSEAAEPYLSHSQHLWPILSKCSQANFPSCPCLFLSGHFWNRRMNPVHSSMIHSIYNHSEDVEIVECALEPEDLI